MSQSSDHFGFGGEGRSLHLARYLPGSDRRHDEPGRTGVLTRNLDEIGHAVNVRHVPDFWKPCEDWTLD